VREFVEAFAARYEQPLLVYEAGDAYRELVLEHGGFPGPAGHGRAYTRLKERQVERLVREHKRQWADRIMLLTGKRRQESKRRAKTTAGVERRGAQVWANPLIDWNREEMRAYRKRWDLPESDVAALIHRSGECNCGAFAALGEREELRSLWPDWFEERIASLERDAERRGVSACHWGERPSEIASGPVGPMCTDCQLRLEAA
jgi:3'-phosphoadenosine 5'-phosphosulfate sulfotransferase (PAPS reductase)/FAD synthetase